MKKFNIRNGYLFIILIFILVSACVVRGQVLSKGENSCTEECKGHDAGIFGVVISRVELDHPSDLQELIEEVEKRKCADSIVLSFRNTMWKLQLEKPALMAKYFRIPTRIPSKTGAGVGTMITSSGRKLDLLQFHPLPPGHFVLTKYYGCNRTSLGNQLIENSLLRVEDFECFGGSIAKKTIDGVALTRTRTHVDAECNYIPGGTDIPLDSQHNHVSLYPSKQESGAYCVVTLTFKNISGDFVGEHDWIPDNGRGCRDLSELSLQNVRNWAQKNNIMDATHYFIKIRIQPWDKKGQTLTFSRILIQPTSEN